MIFFGIFLVELLCMFALSQFVSKLLSGKLLLITNSHATTITILSLLFLPGVVVHELAHWFVASVLFVRTGEMEFLPQIQGDVVKLGSVAIAKTDPVRRFLIGVAPVLVGLLFLFGAFFLLSPFSFGFNYQTAILIYIAFEIGNTMFSSKKDMEGALGLGISLLILGVVLYLFGARLSFMQIQALFTPVVSQFFLQMAKVLLFPIGINATICMGGLLKKS